MIDQMASRNRPGVHSQFSEFNDDPSMSNAWRRNDSGTPDLLRNAKGIREKFSKLDAARKVTTDKVHQLIRVTNDYTNLLQSRPVLQDIVVDDSDSAVDVGISDDLLDDEKIRSIYGRLQRRISQLESQRSGQKHAVMNRSTSANSLNRPNGYGSFVDDVLALGRPMQSSTVSDTEKARGMTIKTPVQNAEEPFFVNDHNDTGIKDISRNRLGSHSSGSSLRPLSQLQMSKLKKFQDDLRNELLQNQTRFSDSHSKPLALERSTDQQRPSSAISKNRKSQQRPSSAMARPQLQTNHQTSRKAPVKEIRATQTSFQFPRQSRAAMVEKEVQTRANTRVIHKRPSSAPSSPRRQSQPGITFERKPLPFVSGKSAGPSHSILVNMQQLLALLKVQNPHLYQACQHLEEQDASLTSLADVFIRELRQLLQKKNDELKNLLIEYDATATATKSESTSPQERVDLYKRLAKMARQMEMKDTDIEKMQKQLQMLIRLRDEAILLEVNHHPCKIIRALTVWPLVSADGIPQWNFTKPTASTIAKSTAPKKRSKSLNRVHDNIQALRDVKMIANVML